MSKKTKAPKIMNHWTGKPVGKKVGKAIREARAARLEARKLARSGHPGKRAEGQYAVAGITEHIRGLYVYDAREHGL